MSRTVSFLAPVSTSVEEHVSGRGSCLVALRVEIRPFFSSPNVTTSLGVGFCAKLLLHSYGLSTAMILVPHTVSAKRHPLSLTGSISQVGRVAPAVPPFLRSIHILGHGCGLYWGNTRTSSAPDG